MLSFTTVLATYAAIVSTVDLLWKIKENHLNRGELRVSGSIWTGKGLRGGQIEEHEYRLDGPAPSHLEGNFRAFMLRATNTGRRPITAEAWIPLFRSAPSNSFPLSAPQEIGESRATEIFIHDLDPLRDGAIGIAVRDSHGKLWHLPDVQFHALQEVMIRFRL